MKPGHGSNNIINHDSSTLAGVLYNNRFLERHVPKNELNDHMQMIYPNGISAFVVRTYDVTTYEVGYGICFLGNDDDVLYTTRQWGKIKITTLFKLK